MEDLDAKSRARQGKDAKQPKQREIQVKLQGIVAKREKALRQMEKELEVRCPVPTPVSMHVQTHSFPFPSWQHLQNMVADATRRAGDRPERIREVSEIRKERRVLDHALHEMNQTHASIEQIRSELADARANKRRVDKFLREVCPSHSPSIVTDPLTPCCRRPTTPWPCSPPAWSSAATRASACSASWWTACPAPSMRS